MTLFDHACLTTLRGLLVRQRKGLCHRYCVCVCVCVQDATPNVVDDFDRIFKLDKLHVLSSGSSRPPRGWDRNLTDDRGTVMTFKRRATKLGSTWSTDTGRHHPPYS